MSTFTESHPSTTQKPPDRCVSSAPGSPQLVRVEKEEFSTVLAEWKQLEAKLSSVSLACSADWTEIWWKNYSTLVRPHFVVLRDNDITRGICLLTQSRQKLFGPLKVNTVHLGTAGEPYGHSVCVEYNDLLVEQDWRAEFCRELDNHVHQLPGWQQFHRDGFPAETDSEWPDTPSKALTVRSRESRYFDLAKCRNSNAEPITTLGKSTRANIRRKLRQVGEMQIEWAETLNQAEDIFAELIDLHQARWESVGEPGAFASPHFKNFQQQLIERLFLRQKVVLARIKEGQKTVGCLYLLVDRNRLLDYVSGFVSFEEFPSPGLLSHYLCLNEALQRGYDAYDFLVGDKQHKENLGKASAQLEWTVEERPHWKHHLRDQARTGKQLAKTLWKREGK